MNKPLLRFVTLLLTAAWAPLHLGAQQGGARSLVSGGVALDTPWSSVGPQQTSTANYGLIAGRILSIAIDPSDATGNTVFVGTTGGGVWKSTNAAGPASNVAFTPVTDALPNYQLASGTITSSTIGAISVQPGGTGVILAGTGDQNDALDSYYGDGILRSADGGRTWTLIQQTSDGVHTQYQNFSFFGLSFAGFAWSTSSPDLVVAAVSSSLEGGIVNAGSAGNSAMGIYYSQDAGQTWKMATLTDGPNRNLQSHSTNFGGYSGNAVTSIAWNPERETFFAAVRYHGYYQSADGITWTRLPQQPGGGLTSSVCPTNSNQPGSHSCPIFRGALVVQPTSGDMFALSTDLNNVDQGIWQDVCALNNGVCGNGTVAFGRQIASTSLEMSDGSHRISQADYNLWLEAVPSGGDTLLFAGTHDIFRCTLSAGCNWRNTTNTSTCAAARVAPAQHAVDWMHGTTTLFFGNDSGLWRTTDGIAQGATACAADDAAHFENLNAGLGSLAEISFIAQDPANASTILAGTTISGTLASNGAAGSWQQVLAGRGQYQAQYVAIDPVSGQDWFTSAGNGVAVNKCALGLGCNPAAFGSTPAIGGGQVSGDNAGLNYPAVWILDPQNPANMLVATCRIWRGPASGTGWSVANTMSGMLDGSNAPSCQTDKQGNPLNAQVRSLAASGTVAGQTAGAERVYAGMAGALDGASTAPGHIYGALLTPSSNALTKWTDLSLSPVTNDPNNLGRFNRAGFAISSIAIDPHDATGQTLYVALHGFSGNGLLKELSQPLVYTSTDGGQHWTTITANLPIPAPVNSVLVDPGDAAIVYLGTDIGVFVTADVTRCAPTGSCWNRYGTGLPNSPVMQLLPFVGGGQSLLRAATYGRGVWQVGLASATPPPGGPTATVSAPVLAFADQAVGTSSTPQSVVLTNTSTQSFTLGAISISATDFVEQSNCPAIVDAGASCTIQVTFSPVAEGARSGTLTIPASVNGGSQLTVALSGRASPGGAIVLTPLRLAFGNVLVGTQSAVQYLTVANTGTAQVSLQPPVVSGAGFAMTANTCGATLDPNVSCTVGIQFSPATAGAAAGVLSVTDDLGTQTTQLSGSGAAGPTDGLAPLSLSFGSQIVNTTSAPQSVLLTNDGDASLTQIQVTAGGDFSVSNGCGASLEGHAKCALQVVYSPRTIGAASGQLTVVDAMRTQVVTLSGSGAAPSGLSLAPGSVDFGQQGVNSTSQPQTLTVTNNGATLIHGFQVQVSGDFATTANGCAADLAPASSCTLQVMFSPSATGTRSGTLTLSSPSLPQAFTAALSGMGIDFQLTVVGSSSTTVVGGSTATYTLQVSPVGDSTGTLTFTCAGAPGSSLCSVTPSPAPLSLGSTTTLIVTVATAGQSASVWHTKAKLTEVLLALLLPMSLPLGWRGRRIGKFYGMMLLTALAMAATGCGLAINGGNTTPGSGGGSGSGGATGSFALTVTAGAPGVQHSAALTLTVQ